MKATGRDPPWGVLLAATAPSMANGILPLYKKVKENNSLFFSFSLPHILSTSLESRRSYLPSTVASTSTSDDVARAIQLLENVYGSKTPVLALILASESVTFGRMPCNDFQIVNPCISSVHCRLCVSRVPHSVPTTATMERQDKVVLSQHLHQKTEKKEETKESGSSNASLPILSSRASSLLVTFTDLSRNCCLVNEKPVGKGELYTGLNSGDVLVLLDAGCRTCEYNVQFIFFFWDDFVALGYTATLLSNSLSQNIIAADPALTQKSEPQLPSFSAEPNLEVPRENEERVSKNHDEPSMVVQKNSVVATTRNEKKKKILLLSAWNAAAQTQRMYGHSVEDFYVLDKTSPLGEGAFGKVYRAALRPFHSVDVRLPPSDNDCSSVSSASRKNPGNSDDEKGTKNEIRSRKAIVPFPPLPSSFSSHCEWNEAEMHRQREAYIAKREFYPSSDIMRASQDMVDQLTAIQLSLECRKRGREEEACEQSSSIKEKLCGEEHQNKPPSADVVGYCFAVKIVPKRRLWLDDSSALPAIVWGNSRVPISVDEHPALQRLIELETPVEEYKEQREELFLHNELRQVHSYLSSSSLFSQETSLSNRGLEEVFSSTTEKNRRECTITDEERNAYLKQVSPQARHLFRRARRWNGRLQCEVNILTSVCHPNVVRLFEIFDNGKEIALVMEQATGGDVWDLLQPAKQVTSLPKMASGEQVGWNSDGGGPLPEFIVKIIITQVLEAVLYLHSMGVIHRDLKLENLLLQKPIGVGQLVRSQCDMLLYKLSHFLAHVKEKKKDYVNLLSYFLASQGSPSLPPEITFSAEHHEKHTNLLCNPLSPLHTVHLPRSMWPMVKVTDFGLSRMLETSSAKTSRKHKDYIRDGQGLDAMYATNQFQTSCGTSSYSAPEVLHNELRPNKIGYSAAVDMFSIGVITFALLTNRLPYPPPKEDHSRGTIVVDYKTPLCFERVRRVHRSGEQKASFPSAPFPGVPLPALASIPCATSMTAPLQFSQWSTWEQDVANLCLFPEERASGVLTETDHSFAQLKLLQNQLKQFCTCLNECEMDVDSLLQLSSSDKEKKRSEEFINQVGSESFVFLPPVSPLGCDFLSSLLTPFPELRLGVRDALRHPWLRDCVETT